MRNLLIILFFVFSSVLSATTYYVSTSGSNTNNGLSTTTPWQTLQYAESRATAPGDIIALKRGDVWASTQVVAIKHGGSAGNPIIWDGSLWGSGANAVIRSSGNRSSGHDAIVNLIATSYVTFKKITVDGNNTRTFGIVIGGHSGFSNSTQNNEHHIVIDGCSILNIGNGGDYRLGLMAQTWTTDISDITIQNCILDGSDDEQLSLYPGKSQDGSSPREIRNVLIKNNTMTNWGRRGASTGYGMQINNKCTNVIIENNTLVQGPSGKGDAFHLESNENSLGYMPTGVIVRYNKITVTRSNDWCVIIQQGQAKKADFHNNLFIHGNNNTDTNGGAVWVIISGSPSYAGAELNFWNNTIYSKSGITFQNDCGTIGAVRLKNNIFYNGGSSDTGNPCLKNNTAGSTTHSNNAFFRAASTNYTKVICGGYKQTEAQLLVWEPTAIAGNPMFKSLGTDFHLQSGSPVIKKGVAISGVTKDLEGKSFGSPPDMGCYQTDGVLALPLYIRSVINEGSPRDIEVTYDVSLANVVPTSSCFTVKVNSVTRALSSVAIVGGAVKLTLTSPVAPGDVTTIAYTKPTTNPLQSTLGGQADSYLAKSVTNSVLTSITDPTDSTQAPMKITIFPNPAHHVLNLLCEYSSKYTAQDATVSPNSIKILDLSGKVVLERRLEAGRESHQIPINLKSGVFVVLLVSKGINLSSHKLIVYN
jgi:hypothetical protein